MRTLVFWGEAPLAEARARASAGATIQLWGRGPEEAAGPSFKTSEWSAEEGTRIESAVEAWVEALGGRPALEGRAFRDLWSWLETPLWPAAASFLRSRASLSSHYVRLVESFSTVFERELPDEVEAVGLPRDEVRLLERCCVARGVLFQAATRSRPEVERPTLRRPGSADSRRGLRSLFGGGRPKAPRAAAVVLVRPESQDDPAGVWERVLRLAREDLSVDLTVVGGDDGVAADRHLDAPAQRALDEAEATFQGQLRALKDAPSTSAAFAWDGVGFADRAAEADLRALLLDLLPRTVGRAEGLRSLLRGGGCKVLCAPALDTLSLAAARAEGVATATLERAEDGPRLLQALLAAGRAEGMVG